MAFNEALLRKTASSPVSCAGTLIATPLALMDYLLRMVRHIGESSAEVRFSGIDQAIHNYLMIEGCIPNAQVEPNGGAVITVTAEHVGKMLIASDGTLVDADGSVSDVGHQYDRDPMLLEAVRHRYANA